MEKLRGPFKDIISLFITMKRSSGYKYININDYVELDNHLYNNNITNLKNRKEIFEISVIKENNIERRKKRYYCLKNLSNFMKDMGMEELYLETMYYSKTKSFEPKILNENEINKIFKEIDLESKKYKDKRKNIYPVLFRLIYSCGLRISEALNIKKANYNKDLGTITIILSKGYVTRLIPLSDSMKTVLDKYINMVEVEDKLFQNISYKEVNKFFQKIIYKLSLEPCRIHDLRHTFAVTSLNKNINKYNEYKLLYSLQIYMGHKNIKNTEYYLRLTEQNYKKLKKIMRNNNKNIFSKEGVEDEK